jgi:hypothetical protein
MAFDDIVPKILMAERHAGSDQLSHWLYEQAIWCFSEAYTSDDAELRRLYLELHRAMKDWLFLAPPPADGTASETVRSGDAEATSDARTSGDTEASPADSDRAGGPPSPADTVSDDPALSDNPTPPVGASQPDEQIAAGQAALPDSPPASAEQVVAEKLDRLWGDVRSERASARYAAAFQSVAADRPDADPAARARRIWEWIHLVCLRLSSEDADFLRLRAQDAVAATADADEASPDEYLVPPLAVIGYRGVDVGHEQVSTATDGLVGMARLARQMDWLVQHDPAVRVGYRIVNSSAKLMPFTAISRELYHRQVEAKLKAPAEQELSELIRLDEMIRGVVPVPLPSAGSWWRSRLDESERALTSVTRQEVGLPQVNTSYKSLLDSGTIGSDGDNMRIAAEDTDRAGPGDVAWVLRAWSGDGRNRDAARVVYVPSE